MPHAVVKVSDEPIQENYKKSQAHPRMEITAKSTQSPTTTTIRKDSGPMAMHYQSSKGETTKLLQRQIESY